MNMKTEKVYIYQDNNCAWCVLNGQMLYAKDTKELQQMLDAMSATISAYNKKQYELTKADVPVMFCNNIT